MTEKQAYSKGTIYRIKLEELKPDPNQPRKYIDVEALKELEKSIKQHGVLMPILFRVDENGQKIIVAGERRFHASQGAGLEDIPALYVDGKHTEIALVENLLRQNLTPMEEAEALQQMKEQFSYSEAALSKVICKGKSTISEILSLNKLPSEIRNECRKSFQIPRDKLVEIAKLEKTEDMLSVYEKVKKENLSRAEMRKLKKELEGEKTESKAKMDKNEVSEESEIVEYSNKLLRLIRKKKIVSNETKKVLKELVKEIENILWQ